MRAPERVTLEPDTSGSVVTWVWRLERYQSALSRWQPMEAGPVDWETGPMSVGVAVMRKRVYQTQRADQILYRVHVWPAASPDAVEVLETAHAATAVAMVQVRY